MESDNNLTSFFLIIVMAIYIDKAGLCFKKEASIFQNMT